MASQMAMRNMSPCEGVKPARGPDEACLRSPGGLNPVFELATIAGEPARMKGVRACHPKAGPTPREDQGVGGRGRKGEEEECGRPRCALEPKWPRRGASGEGEGDHK